MRSVQNVAAAPCPVTGGVDECFLSLPARHQWGESRREGLPNKSLLSPALSSLLRREEREKAKTPSEVYGAQSAHGVRRILSFN